jgi:hypothetical protein
MGCEVESGNQGTRPTRSNNFQAYFDEESPDCRVEEDVEDMKSDWL